VKHSRGSYSRASQERFSQIQLFPSPQAAQVGIGQIRRQRLFWGYEERESKPRASLGKRESISNLEKMGRAESNINTIISIY